MILSLREQWAQGKKNGTVQGTAQGLQNASSNPSDMQH